MAQVGSIQCPSLVVEGTVGQTLASVPVTATVVSTSLVLEHHLALAFGCLPAAIF